MSALARLPEPLAALLGDRVLTPITIGRSSSTTAWADGDARRWVVKVQPVDELDTSLIGEAERMAWLAAHTSVPTVIDAGSDGGREWLVTEALSGSDATDPVHGHDAVSLVRLLGTGLRQLHDRVPVDRCPFDASTDTDVDRARLRMEAGRVDAGDFGGLHRGLAADELYELLLASRPSDPDDLVVLHGDYCVPNVIVDHGTISGYVDVGRCGVGHRHRDLAIGARSIARNFGGEGVGLFFDAYGIDEPRLAWLDFFVMLDEFF
jgi:aminoglycoside phosphotransferase